jgi:hypothetical protein
LLGALAIAGPAMAAEWGGIVPGVSTPDDVRKRYGAPTKSEKMKVEGYDTDQWTYEGARAPVGVKRMIVDFGLLRPDGYKPSLVRLLRIEPKPGVFDQQWVLLGWGMPDGENTVDGVPAFFYRAGLIVYFDKDAKNAVNMVFTIPQLSVAEPKPTK